MSLWQTGHVGSPACTLLQNNGDPVEEAQEVALAFLPGEASEISTAGGGGSVSFV